jgi:hypothetical protein
MKLKYRFEVVDVGEELIAVPVGEDAEKIHGVLKLNKAGKEIADLLQEDTTEEQIIAILSSRYNNDKNIIETYVRNAVESFRNANLIEE